jgi:hypothetical protein
MSYETLLIISRIHIILWQCLPISTPGSLKLRVKKGEQFKIVWLVWNYEFMRDLLVYQAGLNFEWLLDSRLPCEGNIIRKPRVTIFSDSKVRNIKSLTKLWRGCSTLLSVVMLHLPTSHMSTLPIQSREIRLVISFVPIFLLRHYPFHDMCKSSVPLSSKAH